MTYLRLFDKVQEGIAHCNMADGWPECYDCPYRCDCSIEGQFNPLDRDIEKLENVLKTITEEVEE